MWQENLEKSSSGRSLLASKARLIRPGATIAASLNAEQGHSTGLAAETGDVANDKPRVKSAAAALAPSDSFVRCWSISISLYQAPTAPLDRPCWVLLLLRPIHL
jgi:hypothetical protein